MGKSAPACFRIISCGGDSVDHDDLQTPESKASSDRRGWSFRKRSARHRILSNNVTSEVPASASKESQESISVTVAEKTAEIQQREEKTIDILQKEEKTIGIQQKEEKTVGIQQKEEKAIGIQQIEEKSTEIEHTVEKPAEIHREEENSTEIQQKEHISTEIQQKEEKNADFLQREEKTAEIQQKEEKITEIQQKDTSKLSDTKASCEDDLGADARPDETGIILIQTAIRGLLARRDVLRQKSITKLQAVVRGHIVRSHAVGTLRCVQAIIKMQALVRARRAHLQNKKEAKASHSYTYISIEKLLGNAFAHQLMEATPRNKPINIKCDPSKSDSAWKWLERWMTVSSVSNEEPHEIETAVEQQNDNLGHSACNGEDISVQIISKSVDSECGFDAADDVLSHTSARKSDANSLDTDSREFMSPLPNPSDLHNSDESDSKCDVKESAPNAIKNTDMVEVMEPECLPIKEESQNGEEVLNEVVEVECIPAESVREAPDSEELSCMPSQTEVKKLSRKASNPAFIAAQSKFEELSLATTSPQLSTSASHEPGVESNLDKDASANHDQPFTSDGKHSGLAGNSNFNVSAVQLGSSECGTELSVSSTLDSPARSEEAGVNDSGREANAKNGESLEVEAESIVLETDPLSNDTAKLERNESVDAVSSGSPNSAIPAADTPQLDKPADLSQPQVELGSETGNILSLEASPRNDASLPELLATPSSPVFVKPKRSKGEKSKSNRKSKASPDHKNNSNRTPDSASRSSLEQLQEHKSGKRRNSLGSAKPDLKEQEPRDSSSSNPLPSYMQATESARAKAIANGSPRSSPDVNDKEIYIKKRHSLPGSNDRQGSPRINRSLSQAQQNAKGSASQSPQDRKWRR